MFIRVYTSVSNGTVQLFGTKGQKFLHCPGTKGQRDKLKILPRDGTGFFTGCPVPFRDTITFNFVHFALHIFFPMISCFRTPFPVLEHLFLF
jgi:hypothetical protein